MTIFGQNLALLFSYLPSKLISSKVLKCISDFFVHKVETQNGYQIIYSKEFEDFTDRLFVLAGEYSYPGWHFE